MRILGIESSCDETGVAIFDTNSGLLAHCLYSQVEIHAEYGGVVPELASRDHIRKALPLIEQVLAEASMSVDQLDGIAYTQGPGLIGALLVGAALGQSMAWALKIPAVAVHHMEGHLLAPMLEENPPAFPFVALLVSGGHTLLVDVKGVGQYEILGQSVDDAVGEAFDKTAKILGLSYPGGPLLAKLAESGRADRFTGKSKFPRPMTDRPGLDLSFSGLKTFTLNTVQAHQNEQQELDPQTQADIAWAFQDAAIDSLVIKSLRAMKHTAYKRLVVAGGVGANKLLRQRLNAKGKKLDFSVYYPRPEFCTDNGAMIAYAGSLRLQAGQFEKPIIKGTPRWKLDELPSI